MRGSWLAVWLLSGCGGDGGDDGPAPPVETTPSPTGETASETGTVLPGPDLVVLPEHRYLLSQSWSVAQVEVRAGYDLTVSWSGVTTDAWGDALAPGAVERLVLMEILAPPAELPARLAADDLGPDLISVWEADVTGSAFASLSDLSYLSTPFQPRTFLLQNPSKSWLLALARPDDARLDLLAGVVLVPSDAGTATQATLVDGQLAVTFSAEPAGAALRTTAGWEAYSLDWRGIGDDALGKPYDPARGDELFVARYDTGTPAELLASPFTLQDAASARWTMDVERDEQALLELARDGAGDRFPGFESGTWLAGVRCTTCLTRFPLWVSVIEVP